MSLPAQEKVTRDSAWKDTSTVSIRGARDSATMTRLYTRGMLDIADTIPDGFGYSKLPTPQPLHTVREDIDWNRFAISTGILGAAIGGIHLLQYNSWWKDQRGPFHIVDDQDYKANFDKYGHGFGAYYASHFFREAYTWSGFDDGQAVLLGAASACLWEFYVEIEDGFATSWGFSPSDAVADIVGSAFYVARNRIPFLRNFQYKWTYFPSNQLLEDRPDIPGQGLNPIDDYGGQYYWGVANINGLLPKSWQGVVPDWLGLAFGVGGDNLDAEDWSQRKLAYYIALDYDLSKVIPESNIGILNFIRRALEYWHFPAPAFRIQPDPRFFILFPFRMSIG